MSSKTARSFSAIILVVLALALASAAAVFYCYRRGYILYYGDAEAHLKIARRIVDSRTPGFDQLGTVWLPLPHLLMLPLVRRDDLWQSGLAGAIPSAACYVLAGAFLFAAVRRLWGTSAATAATALFALNPNLLYLQATPMTEAIFFAALLALLYFGILFRQTQSLLAVAGAGAAACAGTLTRYEGWFLIPAAALFFLLVARRRRWLAAMLFGALAALGPLAWLAYNRFYFGDALAFYRGPYSAPAIQGKAWYPGKNDWMLAALYYRTAATLCTGQALRWLAACGALVALFRRAWWPLVLLALPGVFYLWSIHSSSGTPIHVPGLWPHSYYNTRYGLALLPFAALAGAALVTLAPKRYQALAALAVILIGCAPWLLDPRPEAWITWKESQYNSEARRAWTKLAADYLRPRYHAGDGIFTSSNDLMGIYRSLGIPVRETLTGDNGPARMGAVARPDLFLREEWAVVMGGDPVQTAINRARRRGPNYELERLIIVKGAPAIEIWHRELDPGLDDDSIYQGARRQK